MKIQHNMLALNTNRQLGINHGKSAQSTEKLSSGYRINRAADDAAGLSISEKMRAQIRGLNRAAQNVQEGISLIQTAEGALSETHSILQRMRELSVQAANDTNTENDRSAIQEEINQLTDEVDRIANHTEYNNGIYPLLGAKSPRSIMLQYLTQKTYTFTAQNEIIIDNKTYHPGDSVSVKGVHVDYEMNGKSFHYLAVPGLWGPDNATSPDEELQWIIQSYDYQNAKCDSVTIDDFGVDENGDIYFWLGWATVSNYSRDKHYMHAYYNPDDPGVKHATGAGSKGDLHNMKVRPDGKPSTLWIQSGANTNQGINISLVDATAAGIGINNINVMSNDDAGNSIQTIDDAIKQVNEYRSNFGAQQNRLEHTLAVDENTAENLQDSESKIRDTDMAVEILQQLKQNLLMQIGQTILAQANQSSQGVLSLL